MLELRGREPNQRLIYWRLDADVGSSCLPPWIKKLGKSIKVNRRDDATGSLTLQNAGEASAWSNLSCAVSGDFDPESRLMSANFPGFP